jgi:hypothetical protein
MDDDEIDGGPIRELVARYVEAVALFDVDLYRSVWAQDSTWVVDGRGSFHGPDAITELFVRLRSPQELAVQRVVSGRATTSGRAGRGRWIIHSLTRTAGEGSELIGCYDDRYVHEDGAWRFVERAFHPLYRGEATLPGRVWAPPPRAPLDA